MHNRHVNVSARRSSSSFAARAARSIACESAIGAWPDRQGCQTYRLRSVPVSRREGRSAEHRFARRERLSARVAGSDFTAKLFRTGLARCRRCRSWIRVGATARRGRRVRSSRWSGRGDEPRQHAAICRKCYIHPAVIEASRRNAARDLGCARARPHGGRGLSAAERITLAFCWSSRSVRASLRDAESSVVPSHPRIPCRPAPTRSPTASTASPRSFPK